MLEVFQQSAIRLAISRQLGRRHFEEGRAHQEDDFNPFARSTSVLSVMSKRTTRAS
jgi:hypothetical protein